VSHVFRDPTEGATARRADLLRRRRDELVMMPHAFRRVYVARRARTAASITIALFGAAMVAIALEPAWAAFLAQGLPGINPAVLCTLVVAMWIVGGFAYVAARALDEHRFAVAMSRFVMPGKDVNEDIERLAHEHPDHAARDMAHRLEVRSAALPVLAAGVLLPVTALYLGAAIRAGGWPVIADFEAAVTLHAKPLALLGVAGAASAIAMTKRAMRLPSVAPLLFALAIVTAGLSVAVTAWLVPVALIIGACALVVRKLRIERELLDTDDPAAGSEVFTIRGALRGLRASIAPVVARVRSIKPIWVLVTGLLAISTVTAYKLVQVRASSAPSPLVPTATATAPTLADGLPTQTATGSRFTVDTLPEGVLRIELELADEHVVEIPNLAALTSVPPQWSAAMRVQQLEGVGLHVSAFDAGFELVAIGNDVELSGESCGIAPRPLALRLRGAAGRYVLHVKPRLEPAFCGSAPTEN
jgi:hypothetical protein